MILGHRSQLSYLDKLIKEDKAEGSYLFLGPEKVGRKKVAEAFAKTALCSMHTIAEHFSCDRCSGQEFLHPDIISVKEEPVITIDATRALSSFLSTSPVYAKRKAVIIDNAQTMTFAAASSFLKTLEEPRAKAIIILISNSRKSLLTTIASRAKSVKFGSVPKEEIVNFLSISNISPEVKEKILYFYRGFPGEIFEWLENPEKLLKIEKDVKDFLEISQSDFPKISSFVEALTKKENNEKDLKETIYNWLYYLEQNFNPKAVHALALLEDFERKIMEKKVDPRLFLENFFLALT